MWDTWLFGWNERFTWFRRLLVSRRNTHGIFNGAAHNLPMSSDFLCTLQQLGLAAVLHIHRLLRRLRVVSHGDGVLLFQALLRQREPLCARFLLRFPLLQLLSCDGLPMHERRGFLLTLLPQHFFSAALVLSFRECGGTFEHQDVILHLLRW